MSEIVGWDVGGAHLKAARVSGGRVHDVVQVACPLWLGTDHLRTALAEACARIGPAPLHAVTTTGELTDHFPSRAAGVFEIIGEMQLALAPAEVLVYAARAGFVAPGQVAGHVGDIASANWHASASLVATHVPDALFADMGSTTTDLVPVAGGAVAARGFTDAARLAEGELVYTGLTRTFLMAVCERAPFRGRWMPLMNEYFASMADVHRILGALDEDADQHEAADRREKTPQASRARLARMLGCDAADGSEREWQDVAGWFAECQLRRIEDAARLVLSRAQAGAEAPVVGAGVGAPVVASLARRLGRRFRNFDDLIAVAEKARGWAAGCAPAVATALLLEAENG